MKLTQTFMGFSILFFGLNAASATSMQCGTHLVEDDEMSGPSRAEVEEKCGAPKSSYGDNVIYQIGNATYRLQFNEDDQLETITEEIE